MFNPFDTVSPENDQAPDQATQLWFDRAQSPETYAPGSLSYAHQGNSFSPGYSFGDEQPNPQPQQTSWAPQQQQQPAPVQQASFAPPQPQQQPTQQSLLSPYAATPRVRLAGVDQDFERRVHAALQAAKQETGVDPRLSSAFRTADDQKEIWGRAYDPATGKTRFAAAPPGHSWHERGKAVDIAPGPALNWLRSPDPQNPGRRIGERYGISFFRGEYDPVHAQPLAGWKGGYAKGGSVSNRPGYPSGGRVPWARILQGIMGQPKALPAPSGGIKAYHGSPYDFDKFDLGKIGTGEGAQAYGHGLYFSEHPAVARQYRDDLVALRNGTVNRALGQSANDIDAAIADARKRIANYEKMGPEVLDLRRRDSLLEINRQKLEQLMALKAGQTLSQGRMYEVNINAKPEQFLDWDRPLSEQPAYLRQFFRDPGPPPLPRDPAIASIVSRALKQDHPRNVGLMVDNDSFLYNEAQRHAMKNDPVAFKKMQEDGYGTGDYIESLAKPFINQSLMRTRTGSELYAEAAKAAERGLGVGNVNEFGLPTQRATRALREAGIPGIRYLDQGSRAAGEGTSNYVLFNPDLATIVKKYGVAGMLGAPGTYGVVKDQSQPEPETAPEPFKRGGRVQGKRPINNPLKQRKFKSHSQAVFHSSMQIS